MNHKQTKPPIPALPGTFGRYHPEEERFLKKASAKSDPRLERLLKTWQIVKALVRDGSDGLPDDVEIPEYFMPILSSFFEGFHPPRRLVEAFAIRLSENESIDTSIEGPFLSALVEASKSSRIALNISACEEPLCDFGFDFGKRGPKSLEILGNLQDSFWNMGAGQVTVFGNVIPNIGKHMAGGKITILGNVVEPLGYSSGGGMGHGMSGGEIHIFGEIDSRVEIPQDVGEGRIFHNGVLIAGKR